MKSPWIEFVNHACVLLSDGQHGVLTDPWFSGDIFHHGWSLLVDTPAAEVERLLGQTSHIWISHEHPDHFSPAFFRLYRQQILRNGIIILFQRTRDGRLANYLRDIELPVIELSDGESYWLNPAFRVQIIKADLYDSALLAEISGVRVLNLNDCPLHNHQSLRTFAARFGHCDLLLTQFSYAAWKGGKANHSWRQKAALHKLEAIQAQIEVLKPKSTVLFASFVRFSNKLNSYMNDSVNQPQQVAAALRGLPSQVLFLAPGERQSLQGMYQQPASLMFWQQLFHAVPYQSLYNYRSENDLQSLRRLFRDYQQRLFRNNNKLLLISARYLLPIRPFAYTHVYLTDLSITLRIALLGRLELTENTVSDLAMHSSSLAYLLRHDFGFDTLFVNGCFEEQSPGGFERFAKCFAIGNLNACGVYIRFSTLIRLDVVRLMLTKLKTVRHNLQQQKSSPQ